MEEAVIVAAKRTAIGKFGGSLAGFTAAELGATVLSALVKETGIDPALVEDVILGQVLQAGFGMNPARQAVIKAGLPIGVPAIAINRVCGSGLQAVMMAAQAIRAGDSEIIIAGGQESMSRSPHVLPGSRDGVRMGDWKLIDTMVNDGLTDVFNGYHMGVTAENIAAQWQVSREEQDAFALASQNKAEAAVKSGRFRDEIVPVSIPQRKGDPLVFDTDEYPRLGAKIEDLAKLKPAFNKEGTVTAGNASGINDGASAVMVMSASKAAALGLKPLATIRSYAVAGVEPKIMGIGPAPASQKALQKAGWSVGDLDLIEANEAFAVQAIAVNREMGWDLARVNVNGGAIALGHPIGASGNRVFVTLLHEMIKRDAKKGLATLCIGGGMGVSVCVER